MSEHGDITKVCDLFAFCKGCDPLAQDGQVLYGFDGLDGLLCPDCSKLMTGYGVSFFECLAHGTNCPDCVEQADRTPHEGGSVIITRAQVDALTSWTDLRTIAAEAIAAAM